MRHSGHVRRAGQGVTLPPPRRCGDLHAPEAGGEMHRHVLVALFEAVVLADVMQVVPTDDNGALHLHLGDHTWATEVCENMTAMSISKHALTVGKLGWRFGL